MPAFATTYFLPITFRGEDSFFRGRLASRAGPRLTAPPGRGIGWTRPCRQRTLRPLSRLDSKAHPLSRKKTGTAWRHANIGRLLNNAVRRFEGRVLELMSEKGH